MNLIRKYHKNKLFTILRWNSLVILTCAQGPTLLYVHEQYCCLQCYICGSIRPERPALETVMPKLYAHLNCMSFQLSLMLLGIWQRWGNKEVQQCLVVSYPLIYMGQWTYFPTMRYKRPAKPQISLRICAVWSELLLVAWVLYDC